MPLMLFIRLALLRLVVIVLVILGVYLGLAAIDYFFGTNAIAVIWQWLARLWQILLRWLQFAGKLLLRAMPGFVKRFVMRRGLSGVWKIATSAVLALLFAILGGERYEKSSQLLRETSARTQAIAGTLWNAEIYFLPKWLRAGLFIVATAASIYGFVAIQQWAETRNAPSIFGIDPWSLLFGFVASFVLTKLPLIGFDHFLAFVFRPLQHRYRRFIRRNGAIYIAINWLAGLRPLRRRAELERKLFMRRWKREHREKSYAEVRRAKRQCPEQKAAE